MLGLMLSRRMEDFPPELSAYLSVQHEPTFTGADPEEESIVSWIVTGDPLAVLQAASE
jgi:hypothetical protein